MEQECIIKAQELFNVFDKWNSFLKLTSLKDKIINKWYSILKDKIESEIQLDSEWNFDKSRMQWYLKEFGKDSLSIWLEFEYFSLYADNNQFNVK